MRIGPDEVGSVEDGELREGKVDSIADGRRPCIRLSRTIRGRFSCGDGAANETAQMVGLREVAVDEFLLER